MKTRDIAYENGFKEEDFVGFLMKSGKIPVRGFVSTSVDDSDVQRAVELYRAHLEEKREARKQEALNKAEEQAREAERKAEENAQKEARKAEDTEILKVGTFRATLPGAVFHIEGARGRSLDVFPHKVIITVRVTAGSVITGNAADGEKTIYFGDCIGLQYKRSGMTLGYLQFETAAPAMNNAASNFYNENTFTFDSCVREEDMDLVAEYVRGQMEKIKVRMYGTGLE